MIISGLGLRARPRRGTRVMAYSTKHNDHRSRASASRAAHMAQLEKNCEHAQRRVDHYRAMIERFKWSGWDTRAALDVLETHQHSLDFHRQELEAMRSLSDQEFRDWSRSNPTAPR